jgi:hypothetical protein
MGVKEKNMAYNAFYCLLKDAYLTVSKYMIFYNCQKGMFSVDSGKPCKWYLSKQFYEEYDDFKIILSKSLGQS